MLLTSSAAALLPPLPSLPPRSFHGSLIWLFLGAKREPKQAWIMHRPPLALQLACRPGGGEGRRVSLLLGSTLALLFYKQASSLRNHMLGNDESGGCIPCMSRDA